MYVYLECFILEASTTIQNSQQKSSGMTRAEQQLALNRFEWLMRKITIQDHNAVRADFFSKIGLPV